MTAAAAKAVTAPGWLRNRPFDLCFIFGLPAIAIICGNLMAMDGEKYLLIAYVNTALLAQPHFIATFTRIAFDRGTARKHFFLLAPLPLLVIAAVSIAAYAIGDWFVASVYLYWQWWHYTRQSYGISRMYLAGAKAYTPHRLFDHYALYALPLCGILYRSYQQPAYFLGYSLYTFPVPLAVVLFSGIAAGILCVMQAVHWQRAWRQGTLPLPYLFYIASHYAVFATGYLLVADINFGWLVINMWHNTQYLAFVWLYNNRRFSAGVDPREPFMSHLSQTRMLWLYAFWCVFLAMVLHALTGIIAVELRPYTVLPGLFILSMSINFHHYIVDAIVWKRKRRTVYA